MRQRGNLVRVGSLISVVVPICGTRGCLSTYIRDTLSRACGGVRVVYISSKSASSSPRVLGGFTSSGPDVGVVARGGTNNNTTEGGNLSGTSNGCICFFSDSSVTTSSLVRGTLTHTNRYSTSLITFRNCAFIGSSISAGGFGDNCGGGVVTGSRDIISCGSYPNAVLDLIGIIP